MEVVVVVVVVVVVLTSGADPTPKPDTAVGIHRFVSVPSPTSPVLLSPQHWTLPEVRIAQE